VLAQPLVVGVLHHRLVAGVLQRELPAFASVLLRGVGRRREHVLGNAGELAAVGHEEREVVGRVHDVVLEFRPEARHLLLDREEARLLGRGELRAAQAEIAQLVLDVAPARGRGRRESRVDGERLEAGVQALVLSLLAEELRDPRQRRVVGLAQLGRVDHGVQVRRLAPGAREALVGVVERLDEVVPGGRGVARGEALDGGAALRDQLVDGGRDVLRADVGESGEAGKVEEGIHGSNRSGIRCVRPPGCASRAR
jgi:hypothetical protein